MSDLGRLLDPKTIAIVGLYRDLCVMLHWEPLIRFCEIFILNNLNLFHQSTQLRIPEMGVVERTRRCRPIHQSCCHNVRDAVIGSLP